MTRETISGQIWSHVMAQWCQGSRFFLLFSHDVTSPHGVRSFVALGIKSSFQPVKNMEGQEGLACPLKSHTILTWKLHTRISVDGRRGFLLWSYLTTSSTCHHLNSKIISLSYCISQVQHTVPQGQLTQRRNDHYFFTFRTDCITVSFFSLNFII